MNGAEAIVEQLEAIGAGVVFGLPGVHNLSVFGAIRTSSLRLVGVRHEQTAVYAADGQARVTGRPGVAIVTTGPGAANALAATGEAYASHSPVVIIATDIAGTLRRPGVIRGVLHETRDQAAMFAPVVKRTLIASEARQLPGLIHAAYREALAAPAGPVYLQIPTDLLIAEIEPEASAAPDASIAPDATALPRALELLRTARRPLIWAGAGAVAAGAGNAVAELAGRLAAPVFETYGARGLIGRGHPCAIGLPPHLPAAGALWDEADLVISIGSDLDGMNTQNWRQPQPPALITINVDSDDAGKNYRADVALSGDARLVTSALIHQLPATDDDALTALAGRLSDLRAAERTRLRHDEPGGAELLDTLEAALPPDAVVVCDMCIPGYWAGALLQFERPRRLLYPIGWGTLGFGFPASIGAAIADSGPVLAIVGDGGFMYACGELATVAQERPGLTILLVDDGGYGMLRFDQRHAGTEPFAVDLVTPDFVKLAESFGIRATRVEGCGQPLREAIERELGSPDPGMIVCRAAIDPPPTTSPRWYRKG